MADIGNVGTIPALTVQLRTAAAAPAGAGAAVAAPDPKLAGDQGVVGGTGRLVGAAGDGAALEVPKLPQASLIKEELVELRLKEAEIVKEELSTLIKEEPVAVKPKEELTEQGPKIVGNTFRSWGDPHEVSGDGLKFDNMLTGTFVAFRSASGDLELQKYQSLDESGRWPGATLNKAAGVKVGENLVSYDIRGDKLSINGQSFAVKAGANYPLPGGGSVSVSADGQNIHIDTPRGDRVTVEKKDGYIDFSGSISPTRPSGSVFGSLGNFDADTDSNNDMRLPNGQITNNLDAFLEAWRVRGGNLIPSRAWDPQR